MNPTAAHVSGDRTPLLTATRRELVVCTQVALSARAQRPPGRRNAVLGSVSRHSRRDRAPPPQKYRRGARTAQRCPSGSPRRPPTRCRRTSTRRHNRSNRRRCPGQTRPPRHPPSGSSRSATGLIETQQRIAGRFRGTVHGRFFSINPGANDRRNRGVELTASAAAGVSVVRRLVCARTERERRSGLRAASSPLPSASRASTRTALTRVGRAECRLPVVTFGSTEDIWIDGGWAGLGDIRRR